MSTLITIFYSWQSDSDKECNNRAIRKGLTESVPKLEETFPNFKISIDEATRDLPGSPNIPASIFEKITAAEIFVADITTINPEYAGKNTPNPNVIIELGFAVATLGWERIIMLYNTNIGGFPDNVPFDFDRHRIMTFNVKDKSDTNGKGNLRANLTHAIQLILEKNPLRPDMSNEKINQIKRKTQDASLLTKVLSTLHLPLLDKFISEAPKYIDTRIFHYYEGFHSILGSSAFHLYDKKAYALLRAIDDHWTKSLSYDHSYRDSSSEHIQVFGISTSEWKREDDPKKREEQAQEYYRIKEKEAAEFELLESIIKNLGQNLGQLLTHIRETYIDINFEETTKTAIAEYKTHYTDKD